MKTCFSTAAARTAARWNFLGGFACITLVLASTTPFSFAGAPDGGEHASRGGFTSSVSHAGFNAAHGGVAARNPYLNGNRGEPVEHPEYRGPLVGENRETGGNRNGFLPRPITQLSTVRRPAVVPQTRELNPSELARRPFGARGQGSQRNSAALNTHRNENGVQHLSSNPAASENDARINEKFQHYENKYGSYPQMSDDRKRKLDRTRDFFFSLIGLGYAPFTIDSWCDDLLDDRVDDGMPMDLVDTYWGQPIDTQEFVEYNVPYELYTYLSDDGNYHQVTYRDGVVSTPNVIDAQTR
jgi:hypothetical protein